MEEHVCPVRQVTIGQLQGVRTERGLTYVSVKIPGGEAMVGVDAFPALEWIERNTGRWVKVVKEAGKPVQISLVPEPPQNFKKSVDPGTGREFLGCTLCDKMLGPAPSADGHCDMASLVEVGRTLADHMQESHPDEWERMRVTYT